MDKEIWKLIPTHNLAVTSKGIGLAINDDEFSIKHDELHIRFHQAREIAAGIVAHTLTEATKKGYLSEQTAL